MTPTRDDFDIWSVHPVTQYVMKAMATHAQRQRDAWVGMSWDGGKADPDTLIELRTRADTLDGFCGLTFEAVQSLNGDSAEDADD
jgi:hypothetical protein